MNLLKKIVDVRPNELRALWLGFFFFLRRPRWLLRHPAHPR